MPTKIQVLGKLKFYSKPYGRQWKWRYQLHGNFVEPVVKIPKNLKGIKIVDPLHPEKNPMPLWEPSRRHPILEPFFPQLNIRNHPDFKEDPIKLFDESSKFHAGIQQVCLLTKTKPINGLPSVITKESNKINFSETDSLVKNFIRQALAYDATKIECPSVKIPNDPKFRIGREFGTPHKRQMEILLENLIRLCNINASKLNTSESTNRKVNSNNPISTIFSRGDDLIQIRHNSEFTLFTKTKPAPVSTDNEIEETKNFKFIDMYPIFPTVDLSEENVYNLNKAHTFGWENDKKTSPFENVHTFFHSTEENSLNKETNISNLIMFAFGYAHAQSQILKKKNKLELDENFDLKKPIVVNGISISNERLNYVVYQLNTLNLENNSGIKNIAYYEMNDELYFNRPTIEKLPYPTHKNVQRLALRYLDYNPNAFKKIQSILVNNTK